MSESPVPTPAETPADTIRRAARACPACARYGTWNGPRLIEPYIPPVNLGHDGDAHRIYNMLQRAGIKTAEEMATYSDVELLNVANLGPQSLARIREVLPEPVDGA